MFKRLSTKIFFWLLCNLLILLLAGGCILLYIFFGHSNGLVPASYFSGNVDHLFRTISVDLQNKPTRIWHEVLERYDREGIAFHLVSMDDRWLYFGGDFIPPKILEIAKRIPRTPFTLCPTPENLAVDSDFTTETGLAPTPPAIFTRFGTPPLYWYGRTLVVPDNSDNPHYLLLAASSDSFDGDGLFFNYRQFIFIGAAILALSYIWWLPFILHVTRPLLRMSGFAATVAANGHYARSARLGISESRADEIGRLGQALEKMTQRLEQRMAGQSQFIRHIAHELNTSLGHCNLGLAVLEKKTQGDLKDRVHRLMGELENLGALTTDVLDFLRANSSPNKPVCKFVQIGPIIEDVLVSAHMTPYDIRISIADNLTVWGDTQVIRRALANAVRNAITYAGSMGPIFIFGQYCPVSGNICIEVRDSGPGVPEKELPSIMEPFFRGAQAQLNHPCGSGLGLAIIRSGIEQCGGKIIVRNLLPRGFSISMYFLDSPEQKLRDM